MSVGNGSAPQGMEAVDVVVVGGGNAGFTAAHAAAVRGRKVVLIEKGSEELAGGNSFDTAGDTRIAHSGLADLLDWVEPDERHSCTEVPHYTADEYAADLAKVTEGRNDPELTKVLVEESKPTLRWLNSLHVLGRRAISDRHPLSFRWCCIQLYTTVFAFTTL